MFVCFGFARCFSLRSTGAGVSLQSCGLQLCRASPHRTSRPPAAPPESNPGATRSSNSHQVVASNFLPPCLHASSQGSGEGILGNDLDAGGNVHSLDETTRMTGQEETGCALEQNIRQPAPHRRKHGWVGGGRIPPLGLLLERTS